MPRMAGRDSLCGARLRGTVLVTWTGIGRAPSGELVACRGHGPLRTCPQLQWVTHAVSMGNHGALPLGRY